MRQPRRKRAPASVAGAATLLGHYERLVSAQATLLERLQASQDRPASELDGTPRPEPGNPAATPPQVAEKLALLLPVIAQAIASKLGLETAVPTTSPEQEVLRALFASLSEEQLGKLLQVLRPEQLAALHALRQRFAPVAAEAAKPPAARSSPTGPDSGDSAEPSVAN